MTIEQLGSLHQSRPFVPFRLHTADGRAIDVLYPELLAHAPDARTIAIATSEVVIEIFDLLLITSLEIINGKKNVRQRKR